MPNSTRETTQLTAETQRDRDSIQLERRERDSIQLEHRERDSIQLKRRGTVTQYSWNAEGPWLNTAGTQRDRDSIQLEHRERDSIRLENKECDSIWLEHTGSVTQ